MKNFWKIFGISISSALLGGVIAVYLQNQNEVRKPAVQDPFAEVQRLFHDDFFFAESPFEDMKKMSQQLQRSDAMFGSGSIHEISQREDEQNIYFEISLKGIEGESVKTSVANGLITISGEVKKSDSGSVFSSSFSKSLPLPEGIEVEKMEMENEKDKLILKFPKQAQAT